MELQKGEVHIWKYILDQQEYEVERAKPVLSVEEKKRCSEYLNDTEKIRYTCNHRFVRQVLSKYTGTSPEQIKFSKGKWGKPFIETSDLFFSYSYRTTFCLLAISKQTEIGVDIEKIKILQDAKTFASFSFSEKEREIIFNSDKSAFLDTLFTFWTFKEAAIKALGVGLNADLTQIDLSDFYYTEQNSLAFDEGALYTIKRLGAEPGYKAAVALKGRLKHLVEFDFKI
jgi:4'-phosphopantetheinyl transferase